ncbi:hypothetical protein GF312_00225 [Candidatus Poribacteria bacterium]|nr:hypothetical protein [Candidatus Poribacteria bacterium]
MNNQSFLLYKGYKRIFKLKESYIKLICIGICFILIANTTRVYANDEETIANFNKTYNRAKSKVMIRQITKPTLAQLDYAAYNKNPMFHIPEPSKLIIPDVKPGLKDMDFNNSIVKDTITDSIKDIPLTDSQKNSPMAWTSLLDYLAEWDYDEALELMIVSSEIITEKWDNDRISRPLQQITTAYLREDKGEIWVKIEFEYFVNFLDGVDDEDKDGYLEIYGLIDKSKYSQKLLAYIKSDYMGKTLSSEEINDYFYDLSADWYEAIRTETLDISANRPWPNKNTEPEIVKEMKGLTIQNATAVIRGNPFDTPIYNIFLVKSSSSPGSENPGNTSTQKHNETKLVTTSGNDMQENIKRWQAELKNWGDGSWEKWVDKITPFRDDIEKQLKERPAEIKGLIGKYGFLFFRGALEYLTSCDLRLQENERDPYPAIVDYKNQLEAKGIDFLFVIIPTKAEIFPRKISAFAPDDKEPYVTPYTRKLMLELADAGVEIIDLMPAFIEEQNDEELIYMTQDTHWTARGIQLAAKIIGERIKAYSWYNKVCKNPIKYGIKEVEFTRGGDIRGMLPDNEKLKYRPMKLKAYQVTNPDGSLYQDDKSSPVVMLGDSFCGVYQVEDPKHAGLSAHVAREIGMPVDLIVAYGSGPKIRGRLARRGSEEVSKKKLVIWTTASRDLYNYWSPWSIIKVP